MNGPLIAAACACWIALAAQAATPFDAKDWRWNAPVQVPDGTAGFVRLTIPPEALERSQPSLGDLRVTDSQATLTPHVLYWPPVAVPRERLAWKPVALLNRTFVPEGHSTVTLDFGVATRKNRIEVALSETNYRRKALLEGSPDGQTWSTVVENQWLFDVTLPSDHFEANTVSFPVNDFRYLRLTVYAMPDDPRHIEINGVQAVLAEVSQEKHLTPLPVRGTPVTPTKDENGQTIFAFDLGSANVPIDTLQARVSDPYFHRAYALFGRSAEKEPIHHPTEQGLVTGERDVPWSQITSGVFYRVQDPERTQQSLSIENLQSNYRYLLLRVYNGDAPELQFEGFDLARRDLPSLVFEVKAGQQYRLHGGHPRAGQPAYDLAESVKGLAERSLPNVTLGPLEARPGEETPVPWTDRYRALLWVAFLVVAVPLLWLTVRSFSKIQQEQR